MQRIENFWRFISDYSYYRKMGHYRRAAWHLASKTLPE
jgi:hypothetical protein